MKWTQKEIEFLKENYLKQSNIELARNFNRDIDSISNKLIKLDIHRPKEWNSERMKKENPMFNKESMKKMVNTIKEKYPNWGDFNKGRKHPELTKRNLENNPMNNPESVAKMVNKNKGKHLWANREHPKGMLGKISKHRGRKIHSEEYINKLKSMTGEKNNMFGKHHSQKTKKILYEINIKNWSNEEFAKKMFKSWRASPNKCEKYLDKIIKENNIPFRFVGDGKYFVNQFCPDFIDLDNKKIIELFGKHWHIKKNVILRDINRFKTYKDKGYKFIIIWDYELIGKNKIKEEEIVNKINQFIKS